MTRSPSFLRRLEYQELAKLTIDGTILDIGGSKKSGYHELLKGSHTITTANIDASYGTDLLFDAEEVWPISDASYAGVLFVNVLEHLYRYEHALTEAKRVLQPGGTVAGVVPFLLNVHSGPRDYFRYTRFALERMLTDAGFKEVQVRELGTGAFSVIYQTLLSFVRWSWLASLLIPLFAGLDRVADTMKPHSALSKGFMPLGYYFEAKA